MKLTFWLRWLGIGGLLGIGFLVPWLWWCGVVGIAASVHGIVRSDSYTQIVGGVCISWWVKYALALLWFWSTYPIEWLPLQSGGWQLVLIFFYWSTAALWLSVGSFVLVGVWWLIRSFLPQLQVRTALLIFPILWVWGEVFGSVVFSIATLGEGGFINTKFSFGYTGYLLAEHATALQLASVGGVYILSFTISALAVAFYIVWSNRSYWWLVSGVAVFVVSLFLLPTNPTTVSSGYRVAAIDTYFGPQTLQTDTTQNVAQLQAAVAAAVAQDPDYIILPEDARYLAHDDAAYTMALAALETAWAITFIDSGQVWRGETSVLQATVYDNESKTSATVDKRYLVPQGEYTPWLYKKILQLFGQGDIVSYIERGRGYAVGDNTNQNNLPEAAPGILFCFESVDPLGVRTIASEREAVPFVAHIVSHAWFHEPQQLWQQLDAMLRVQAVWNDVYIVSAGNQVEGAVYTPFGTIENHAPVATGADWQVRLLIIPDEE